MNKDHPIQDLLTALTALPPWLQSLLGLAALALGAASVSFVVRQIIQRLFWRAGIGLGPQVADELTPVARHLANVVPAILVARGVSAIPHLAEPVVTVTRNVAGAYMVLTLALAAGAALNVVNTLYRQRPGADARPIKGYLQVFKIIVYAGATILIAAALMEQSPLLLLSGLGAMAAVLMLVFKDTILSLVASVQLTSNDMLRVGDWIEMPQLHADGDVIDIALHTVKVQNWDKTITTIPTHRLITESYKNWRGMFETGGRRIKRTLLVDQGSVRFLSPDERIGLQRFALIEDYLVQKQSELERSNAAVHEAGGDLVNTRRVTNIGTFRAYVLAYLHAHPSISQDMTLLVRQLQPTPQGLPLEIYAFTNTTAWAAYEAIQADIFDHLIAILPEFGLQLFQSPSGKDVERLVLMHGRPLSA
ncbi:mechanosensitive ion channel family protein [Phenylobacterium sp. 58.2.17]|uniref:mechanosensitive ion channel family protein n=1 Tax=Phenylobacterium sp. 58.2.17 TaxID=2969306 RepID=UPI002263C5CF|nr:mechanosensitive ion channel family protein [Phenylobacterium sp. 58.2.17]MCX7585765.1 mechanosensitive ion channel family protein [Phenylobacterium sp. 58.2.17]